MERHLLPSFEILLADSVTRLNTADITHCRAMTQDIVANIRQFKNIPIYHVIPYPFKRRKVFYRYFKLSNYPNIAMGKDLKNYFFYYFKTNHLPYIAVYDSKKKTKTSSVGRGESNHVSTGSCGARARYSRMINR